VFAPGRGGANIPCPAPPHMWGRGVKCWPRPAPQQAGPRPGNGPGTPTSGPGRCTAAGPHVFSQGPAFRYGAPPIPGAPSGAPLLATVHWPFPVHRPGPRLSLPCSDLSRCTPGAPLFIIVQLPGPPFFW